MSALSHGVGLKFVGFLKNLFRKSAGNNALVEEESAYQPETDCNGSVLSEPVLSNPPPGPPPGHWNGHGIHIPLQAIVVALPLELRAKVKEIAVGDLTVPVPIEKVLSQLAQGTVRIPFGEVRKAAPHVFTSGTDCDHVLVSLPLSEILPRLNPALLLRRPAQKQVEVSADIISPFDANGQGLVFSVGNAKPETPAPTRHITPVPQTPLVPARPSIASMPQRPPLAPVAEPLSTSAALISPISPITPISPLPPTLPRATPLQMAAPAAPVPVPQPSKPVGEQARLSMALTALAEGWPEALRQEIVQLNLVDARVGLPVELVENALKRGRVVFTWKVLRSWIRPVPLPTVSAHDATELELPLKALAPLFLARQDAAGKSQQKVAIDESIPNLFFGFPKAEASPANNAGGPVSKPVDTNYYVWEDTSEVARVDETEYKRKAPGGTDFVTRHATPNEIVSRAAALDGVAGALIALPDGLMVANRIPAELNGDTLAAFLPQIFAKMSQCTKELRMGELNNLNFTVGNVPWKIFRVNAIFFAAFGRAGEPLPTAKLAALAAELDRKNK
jgi:predicted regulator of Ras-like GTPase activity (Roadblock/LC7/MglB family)